MKIIANKLNCVIENDVRLYKVLITENVSKNSKSDKILTKGITKATPNVSNTLEKKDNKNKE